MRAMWRLTLIVAVTCGGYLVVCVAERFGLVCRCRASRDQMILAGLTVAAEILAAALEPKDPGNLITCGAAIGGLLLYAFWSYKKWKWWKDRCDHDDQRKRLKDWAKSHLPKPVIIRLRPLREPS